MRFEDFKYERPNTEELEKQYQLYLEELKNASTSEEQIATFNKLNEIRRNFSTMAVLCNIRNTLNTKDEFYEQEKAFFNEYGPHYGNLENQLVKILISSKFKDELISMYGKQLFTLWELKLKTFDPVIIEDLQKENKF